MTEPALSPVARRSDGAPTTRPVALLTLGRLPVALEVAHALHALGYRVLIAESLGLYPARFSRSVAGHRHVRAPAHDAAGYLDDLQRIVAADTVSLVVPVSEETPHVARLQGCVHPVPVLCCSHDTVLELHDKLRFIRLCERIGVAVPRTQPSTDAASLCAEGDWVGKPRLSCAGRGLQFGRAGESIVAERGTLVQQRIDGPALCSCSVVRQGKVLATCVYRSLLDSGSVSVRFEAVPVPAAIEQAIARIACHTRASGFLSFDFLLHAHAGWLPIECNPRATSGLHLFSSAALVKALEAVCDTSVPVATEPVEPVAGVIRQEFWSALAVVQGAWLRRLRRKVAAPTRGSWRALLHTRDITWRKADPLPFLLMTPASAPLLWRAWRAGRPIAEVATQDVGWYEQ